MNNEINLNSNNITRNALNCSYCDMEYSKNNKPLVLKCSHNICQKCHLLNKNKIVCLICGNKYEGKHSRRFPINFLLLELIGNENNKDEIEPKETTEKKNKKNRKNSKGNNKTTQKSTKVVETFKCITCELFFPNKFHFSSNPSHETEVDVSTQPTEEREILLKKSEKLMQNYKNYNEQLDKTNEVFFDFLIKSLGHNKDGLIKELERNDPLENYQIIGIINQSDKHHVKEFSEKYLSNHKIKEALDKSKSFDELLNYLVEIKDVKIHHFLSSFFYFEEIRCKKLNSSNLENKINKLFENVSNTKDEESKRLFKLFTEDLNVEVYNALNLEEDINKNIKLPFILSSKKELFIFDPMTENINMYGNVSKFFQQDFQSLDNFSCLVDNNFTVFVTGGQIGDCITVSNCFGLNINTKEIKNYENMLEPRHSHSSILISNKLYVIGGTNSSNRQLKSFEKLSLIDNTWSKLTNCPHEFKNRPSLLNFMDDYIYVIDDLSHFLYYEITHDKWTVCKPSYRGSYYLYLKNFISVFYDSNVIILGGTNDGLVNQNIYHLKDGVGLISIKGEFKVNDVSSIIDYGFIIGTHYLMEYSENNNKLNVYYAKELSNFKWDLLKTQDH